MATRYLGLPGGRTLYRAVAEADLDFAFCKELVNEV